MHDLGRFEKYIPLLSLPFDKYYYSRTSNPFTYFNESAHELYAPEFMSTVSKSHSLEPIADYLKNVAGNKCLEKMLYVDTKTWLPDDLLIKADKITMANSVELRVPLLDHKVLEYAAGLPSEYKVHGITTKYILKRVFDAHVPSEIIKRKKTGFPLPYESWQRTSLKDFVSDILLDGRTSQRGYFSRKVIQRLIADNLDNGIYAKEIFSLISLELWHRAFVDKS